MRALPIFKERHSKDISVATAFCPQSINLKKGPRKADDFSYRNKINRVIFIKKNSSQKCLQLGRLVYVSVTSVC